MKALIAFAVASLVVLTGCGTTGTNVTSSAWESTGGPYAQNVTALLLPEGSATAVLAGTETGEVFKTDNPGTAWREISLIRKGAKIHRFVRDPEHAVRLYAATNAGLFVSTNDGAAWTEITLHAGAGTPVGVRSLAIDPWNTSILYAGTTGRGILRSDNGGMTWSPANEGIPGMDTLDVREILIDMSKPDRILAAVSSLGVVLSSDAGKSWSRLTEEFTATGSTVTHIVQNRQTPSTIVYGTDAGGIRKSTDGGATWSPSRNGFAEGTILSLLPVPGHPEALLAGTESGLLVTRDFGSSWTDITGTLPRLPVALALSSDGRIMYTFGEGIGLQQSADTGATWTHVDEGLGGATIRLLTTDRNGGHLYAALEHAVLACDSTTGSWRSASSGLPGGMITSLVVESGSPLHLLAATTLGGFRSTDGGQSWQPATRSMRITPKVLEPHPRIHTRMLASGTLGLDVSTDRGATWSQTKPYTSRYFISAFTFAPRNTGIIYGAAAQAIVMSRDGGFLWESSRYGLHGEEFAAITLDRRNPSVVYAWTSSGGGYRSLDGGLEWNSYAPPWKQGDSILIAYDRFQPSSVVALVNSKDIHYSSSGGGTWFTLPSVQIDAPAQSLWWNAPSETLYIGTKGKGVRRIALGQSVREVTGEQEVANGE